MAIFNHQPKMVEFSLPYSDGSGERIKVTYIESKADIRIDACDFILIDKSDLDWLIDVLQDARRLRNENVLNK